MQTQRGKTEEKPGKWISTAWIIQMNALQKMRFNFAHTSSFETNLTQTQICIPHLLNNKGRRGVRFLV